MLCWWSGASYYIKRRRGLALFCGGPQQKAASRVESVVSGPIKKDTSIWKLTVSGESQSESEREFDRSTILQARLQGEERWTDLFFWVTTTTNRPVVLRAHIYNTLPACLSALMLEWIEWKPPPMMNRGKDCNPLITAHMDHTTYGQVGICLLNYLNIVTIDPYRLL